MNFCGKKKAHVVYMRLDNIHSDIYNKSSKISVALLVLFLDKLKLAGASTTDDKRRTTNINHSQHVPELFLRPLRACGIQGYHLDLADGKIYDRYFIFAT